MAAPVYATDLTNINLVETSGGTTNWTAIGSGGAGLNSETDYYIQGDGCISKNGWTAATKGMIYSAGATTIASGDAVFIWLKQNNRNLLDTKANGGGQFIIGSGTAAYDHYYIDGNNVEGADLAGWRNYAIDPTQTASTTTGSPTATTSHFGGLWKILGSGTLKGAPNGIDAFRHGRELQCTAGDVGNGYATFDGAALYDSNTTRAWGLLTPSLGVYLHHGAFVMGTASTSVDFRDSDRTIYVLDDDFVPSTFNEFEIRNASSNVEWTGISIESQGTIAPFILTLNVGTFTGDNCRFTGAGTTDFASTGSCTNSQWKNSNTVTAADADLSGSSFLTPTVTANTSAVVWNVATNPNSDLTNTSYSKGTNDHHAIEFGTSSPTTINLTGCDFSGFSASQDVNSSIFHVKRTSGTVTINLSGCTSDVAFSSSYRTDGATVNIVEDPVTVAFKVKDSFDDANLSGARVLAEVTSAANSGKMPYQASISITGSGTTATVSHTSHGMTSGDWVIIRGANEDVYNGAYSITVTGANTYTYTTNETIGTSPATGTITCTFALISGTTDGSGDISDSFTLTAAQPFSFSVAQGTTAPYYVRATGSNTLPSGSNLTVTVSLIRDS
jgi:hypothetical protein